jgi:hypothetical protein
MAFPRSSTPTVAAITFGWVGLNGSRRLPWYDLCRKRAVHRATPHAKVSLAGSKMKCSIPELGSASPWIRSWECLISIFIGTTIKKQDVAVRHEPCSVPVESWDGSLDIQENVRTPIFSIDFIPVLFSSRLFGFSFYTQKCSCYHIS